MEYISIKRAVSRLKNIVLGNPKVSILAAALISRITAILYVGVNGEWAEWGIIANNVASGNGYSYYSVSSMGEVIISAQEGTPLPSAYMPPGYVFFLLPFVLAFSLTETSFILIQVTQAVIGAITCLLVYLTSKKIFSYKYAFLTSLIVCFYPTLVYLPSQISSANLYLFFISLILYLTYRLYFSGGIVILLCLSLASGFVALTRAQYILLIPGLAVWLFYSLEDKRYKYTIIFVFLSTLVVSTWTYRNYRVFDEFIPIAQSVGYNLWRGQQVGPQGAWVGPKPDSLREAIRELPNNKHFESRKDSIYLHEALRTIEENPFRSARLSAMKFVQLWVHFWWLDWYPNVDNPIYFLPWIALLALVVYSSSTRDIEHKELIPVYLPIIIITILTIVFFSLPRYRTAMLPSMVILSTYLFKK